MLVGLWNDVGGLLGGQGSGGADPVTSHTTRDPAPAMMPETASTSSSTSTTSVAPAGASETEVLNVDSDRGLARTSDGSIRIVGEVDVSGGATFSVFAASIACQLQRLDLGQSLVVVDGPDRWVHILLVDVIDGEVVESGPNAVDFNISYRFEVSRGQGETPRSTSTCP